MITIMFMCANTLAITVLVDWVTLLITKRDYGFLCYLTIAIAIYYMWVVIATGGILQ